MRKIIPKIALIFSLLIYLLSSNDFLMKKLVPYRSEITSVFGTDRYKFGDLYGFSYLKDFRIRIEKKSLPLSSCIKPGNVNLYMICDSYLWSFVKTDSIFCNVNKLKYARWLYDEQIEEELDHTKKNILIIEVAERHILKLLRDTLEMYYSIRVSKKGIDLLWKRKPETFYQKVLRYLYNEKINQNLEFNLFDYSFFTPFRELKAELNYRLFNRTDKDVSISTDKQYLFYIATTDTSKITSSFYKVKEQDIKDVIFCTNRAYYYFKKLGFDEIYLSIVPNPVTITDPGYGVNNGLIDIIQNSRDLKVPLINIFPLFKNSQKELYYRSDSHWNYDGFQIWLDEVNKILKNY